MSAKKINRAIETRLVNDKEKMLEALHKMPIVQVACQQAGIGRTTYYRWRQEDKDFGKAADEAMSAGELLINDLSESQLIALIRDRHHPSIVTWLKAHHPKYTARLEVSGQLSVEDVLDPEQEALRLEAIRLATFSHTKSESL